MAKQKVRKKSNTQFIGALIVIAVVGIGALGYAMSRPRAGVKPVDPNLPPGTAEGYLVGNPDAPVEIVEFGDFECPACARWNQITEPDVKQRLVNSGQVKFRFFDFPLDVHLNAWPAHGAVACAADQGKFEQMKDQVFSTQEAWSDLFGVRDPVPGLKKAAQAVGVEMGAWQECFDSQKHYPRIKANSLEGVRLGVGQTPSFRIGNNLYAGGLPYDEIKRLVDSVAAALPTKAGKAPAQKAAGKSGT